MHDYLSGDKIDSLQNVLILEKNHHDFFGSMCLWFTECQVLPFIIKLTFPSNLVKKGSMLYMYGETEANRQEFLYKSGQSEVATPSISGVFHLSIPILLRFSLRFMQVCVKSYMPLALGK